MSDYELAHEYDTVNLLRRGGAAKIELNRPDRLNAWNRQFGYDLLAAVQSVADDEEVRAVMVTGAGRGFSSGADLKEMGSQDDRTPEGHPDVRTTLTERYHPIITGIRRMPKPVLAAVNGPAVGIGCSLALACDLIVAAESAYLMLAFVNIGLVPDGGSSLFVPARAGRARAFEMAMLGERVVGADRGGLGADQPRLPKTTGSPTRARRCSRSWPRTDAVLRRDQAPAQQPHLLGHGRAARARGRDPAGDGLVGRLRRGRAGLRPEASRQASPARER